ncbi:MAG: chorismate synthase [Lachnospiraceae bacterium]|nr:chorismate synthase [Lachnospiraceae bacterium]
MAGSVFGTMFKISTWGESHGKGIGVVVDGCPAGIPLCEEDIQVYLNRRRPGQNRYTTARSEADAVEIMSGVFEGKTTGTPISLIVLNKDQRSRDYGSISELYRPGHADYPYDMKYGFRDYRGGGRSSGRETIGRVAAGAIAMKMLSELGITVKAYVSAIGPVSIDRSRMDLSLTEESPLRMPDLDATERAQQYLEECMRALDSSGGVVECVAEHLPAGLGEPVFDKLDANLARAVMSIGAVKAVEIGDGTLVSSRRGSQNNDGYTTDAEGKPVKASNHSGGILGGISDGAPLFLRASFKPTASIAQVQTMLGRDGKCHDESIHGRHDPLIVTRAVVVVEAMTALTIADHLLMAMSSKMENIKKVYGADNGTDQ